MDVLPLVRSSSRNTCINPVITLDILNLHSVTHQLYLNKLGGEGEIVDLKTQSSRAKPISRCH